MLNSGLLSDPFYIFAGVLTRIAVRDGGLGFGCGDGMANGTDGV